MSRLHVTDEGRVLTCGAQVQDCPYLSREDGNRHFDSRTEAEQKAAHILSTRYGMLASSRRSSSPRRRGTGAGRTLDLEGRSIQVNRFPRVPRPMAGEHFDDFAQACASN